MDFVSETLGENVIRALGELQHEDDDCLELAVRTAYLATDREFLSQVPTNLKIFSFCLTN